MHIEFLWDEEKTQKLFRTHLLLFFVGGIVATVYSLLLPQSTHYHNALITIPVIFTLSCMLYYHLPSLHKVHWLFLLFTLESQLALAFFMALSGGFLTIVQFAPYMFLLFCVFELGAQATLILGLFSILSFVGVLGWTLTHQPQPNVIPDFFYYVGSYILIVVIEHNLGKELSLQFEARKRLELVDDLKNQFITLASHYLRTPLTDIKLFVDGLGKEQPSPEQIMLIKERLYSFQEILEKLLTISSFEHGKATIITQPISIDILLSGIIENITPLAREKQVAISYTKPENEIIVKVDRNKLTDAIEGIIDNAIRYNKEGGAVTLSATTQNSHHLILSISDTGKGIEKERLETLFSTFNRGNFMQALDVKNPGMGLGLFLAKAIIEAHGGKIGVTSAINQGSTFTIQLPIPQN